MSRRLMRPFLAVVSMAVVIIASGLSAGNRWNFDFAQYKGDPRPEAQDEFRFVIVGDRTGGAQWGLMPQTFREINLLDPDFVISVGDLIDGYGNDEETVHGIWDEFDKTEMPTLKVPFVYMPGNHDIFNATSKRVYEKRYGPRFKSFNYRGLHFICLNTEEGSGGDLRAGRRGGPDALGEEQLKWLKEDIERNRNARRILIFMHQPAWRWGALDQVYPLLEGLPVNVFAGHYHKYSYEEIRGIPHIVCSATAAYMPEEGMEAYGRFRSYLLASVRDEQMSLALIRLGGVLAPKAIMEQDQSRIRQMGGACAILRNGDGAAAPTTLLFRNALSMPVRLQIVQSTRGSNQYLFDKEEPQVESGAVLNREVDWSSFASSTSGYVEYRVVYRFNNSGGEYQTIDFPIEPRQQRSLQASAALQSPAIDGDLSDWSGATWQPISDRAHITHGTDAWQGPQDLSAQFAVAEDAKNIYVAVRVIDDVVTLQGLSDRDGGGRNNADCIELFASDADDRAISFSSEGDWRRLVVAPSGGESADAGATAGKTRLRKYGQRSIWGNEASTQDYSEGEAAFRREARQYTIEIALSREGLGWNDSRDRMHQLDIAINDRDTGGNTESQLIWAGNSGNAYSSRYYGTVLMP